MRKKSQSLFGIEDFISSGRGRWRFMDLDEVGGVVDSRSVSLARFYVFYALVIF